MVMNIYRVIDRSKVQFDFMIRSENNNFLSDEIKAMGGRIFIMPRFPRQFLANIRAVNHFFATHKEYKVVHMHANSLIYTIPLLSAKKHGVRRRIAHSHNTSSSAGVVGSTIHKLNRLFIGSQATDYFACSPAAGEWMFGKRPYTYIKNGIDLEKFRYSEESRERIRTTLGIQQELVIGHVGRFATAKNHAFLLSVFKHIVHSVKDAKLLLIGEGELQGNIENIIRKEGLEKNVILTGGVADVHEYMNAMDCFIFPSLYEGAPVVLREAQANGLPCVISDAIPQDSLLSDNIVALSLSETPQTWAKSLLENKRVSTNGKGSSALQEFDVNTIAKELEAFYLS